MTNLTSFALVHTSLVSARQLLDLFESTPHLHEVNVFSTTPISGNQTERLVSLAHLKKAHDGGRSSSHLFDRLLIPVGSNWQRR